MYPEQDGLVCFIMHTHRGNVRVDGDPSENGRTGTGRVVGLAKCAH